MADDENDRLPPQRSSVGIREDGGASQVGQALSLRRLSGRLLRGT